MYNQMPHGEKMCSAPILNLSLVLLPTLICECVWCYTVLAIVAFLFEDYFRYHVLKVPLSATAVARFRSAIIALVYSMGLLLGGCIL